MKHQAWVRMAVVSVAILTASIASATDVEMNSWLESTARGPRKRSAQTVVHEGQVTRIVDGDTIRFNNCDACQSKDHLKIRMVNIDAPESHFPTNDGPVVGQQPWGNMATEALRDLITDPQNAELEDFGLDKYLRTLGRLYIKGRDINLEMVRMGMAYPYPICADEDCTPDFFERHNIAAYVAACEDAMASGRGVFNPRRPLNEPPYFFRLRMNNSAPTKFVGDFYTRRLYSPTQTEKVPVCSRVFFLKEREANKVGYFKTPRKGR